MGGGLPRAPAHMVMTPYIEDGQEHASRRYTCDQPGCGFTVSNDAFTARAHYGLTHAVRQQRTVAGVTAYWFDDQLAYREWLWTRADRGVQVQDRGGRDFVGPGWYVLVAPRAGERLRPVLLWQREQEAEAQRLQQHAQQVARALATPPETL
jgi:hypothetical protein